jgi:hypothetical protein
MRKPTAKNAYIVFARTAQRSNELELLGIFDSRMRADEFIDHTPRLHRGRLETHTWEMNRPTTGPFWTDVEGDGT